MIRENTEWGVKRDINFGPKRDIDCVIIRKTFLNIVFQVGKIKKSWLELMVNTVLLKQFVFVHATVNYAYIYMPI